MNIVNKGRKYMKLVSIQSSDRELLEQWFDSEHIYRWFGDSEYWLTEFEYEPSSSFMVYYEGERVGFCRYTKQMPSEYETFFSQISEQIPVEYSRTLDNFKTSDEVNLLSDFPVYFIDYAIGNTDFIGKGLAKKMIQALCEKLEHKGGFILAGTSSLKNTPSSHLLKSQGFYYVESCSLFIKVCV